MRLKHEHAKGVMALGSFGDERKGEWREETQVKADCGKWGHVEREKGVCDMCGARRSDG